jgi:hypothetical protein
MAPIFVIAVELEVAVEIEIAPAQIDHPHRAKNLLPRWFEAELARASAFSISRPADRMRMVVRTESKSLV